MWVTWSMWEGEWMWMDRQMRNHYRGKCSILYWAPSRAAEIKLHRDNGLSILTVCHNQWINSSQFPLLNTTNKLTIPVVPFICTLTTTHTQSSFMVGRFQSHLFAVTGQQIEAAGWDSKADCHASKLQVTLPQYGGQTAGRRLWERNTVSDRLE